MLVTLQSHLILQKSSRFFAADGFGGKKSRAISYCLTLENGHFSVLSVLSSVQGSTWTSAAFGGELGCLVDDIWVSSFL